MRQARTGSNRIGTHIAQLYTLSRQHCLTVSTFGFVVISKHCAMVMPTSPRGSRSTDRRTDIAVFFGQCALETTSSSQSLRALSTGEAEFYALTKAAAHSEQLAGVMKTLECNAGGCGSKKRLQRIAPKCAGCPQTSIQLTLQHSTCLLFGWKQNMT